MTLIEPGGTRTDFNRHLVLATPIPAYDNGVLGQIRGLLTGDVDPEIVRRSVTGDPAKVAGAIVDSVEVSPAPRRLVLGRHAHEAVTTVLRDRLTALEAQRDLAYSTDADDIIDSA